MDENNRSNLHRFDAARVIAWSKTVLYIKTRGSVMKIGTEPNVMTIDEYTLTRAEAGVLSDVLDHYAKYGELPVRVAEQWERDTSDATERE